jgi:hypothetical protein
MLKIPSKILKENDNVTTISIPSEYICEHSFQAFIDRDFNVRGYQPVDFEVHKMEFFGDSIDQFSEKGETEEDIIHYRFSVLMGKIINILRINFDKNGILGGAIFSDSGKILYTTIPEDILLRLSKEFEVTQETEVLELKKAFYVLKNSEILVLDYLQVENFDFIIAINYSSDSDIPSVIAIQTNIINKILMLEFEKNGFSSKETKYWIYSKVSYNSLRPGKNEIILDTHNIKIDKKVIKNLKQIKLICRHQPFEGKIFIDERYVALMQGLSLTIKDAAIFMKNLNKLPS